MERTAFWRFYSQTNAIIETPILLFYCYAQLASTANSGDKELLTQLQRQMEAHTKAMEELKVAHDREVLALRATLTAEKSDAVAQAHTQRDKVAANKQAQHDEAFLRLRNEQHAQTASVGFFVKSFNNNF
jgi:predicted transcriptional regulator